jgi:hypothetical protein
MQRRIFMRKNFGKYFGIIVLVAVIGLSMTGCNTDDDDNAVVVQATNGKLTITGLDDLNNNYVIATGYGWEWDDNEREYDYAILIAAADFSSKSTYTGSHILGGQAVLKVWRMLSANTIGNYNGNHDVGFNVIVSNKSNLTRADSYDLENYWRFGYAKPSWLIEEGFVEVDAFSDGIGTGLYEKDDFSNGAGSGMDYKRIPSF